MSRILITGSADGLGLIAAQLLISQGHEVVLHARNQARVADSRAAAPGAAGVLAGDLSSIDQMRSVARQANDSGRFDAVIHNAGVGYRKPRKITTADGLSHVFAINVLAPYLLTAMITPPRRLVYLSSDMHPGWQPRPDRPAVGAAALEPGPGLLGLQAVRRRPGVRARPALAAGAVQRAGTGLGPDENGRARRAR
jgi:NAD(P)-dependent dehydrogenase (short-subunit alcohol dehydrogenase family)